MIKKFTIFVMNLFLIICTFCLLSIIILNKTILNENYILSKIEENGYYEKTYNNIRDDFRNYILQSGLEEQIFENICDQEKVKNDINMVIDAIYNEKSIEIDVEQIKNTLDYTINTSLAEKNRKPNSEEKEAIATFEKSIVEVYVNNIAYSQKYIEQIGTQFNKIHILLEKIKEIILCIIIAIVILLIFINKNLCENAKNFGVVFLSIGILCICINAILGGRTNNILILNKNFSELIISILYSILNLFINYGIMFIALGIAGILIENYLKINRNKDVKDI